MTPAPLDIKFEFCGGLDLVFGNKRSHLVQITGIFDRLLTECDLFDRLSAEREGGVVTEGEEGRGDCVSIPLFIMLLIYL